MAALVDCGGPQSCCIHSLDSNPIKKTSSGISSLLSVSLEAVDMQSINSEGHSGSEEEIARNMDALSSRLKIAQFVARTLSQRLEELQKVLTRVKQTSSASSSSDSWGSAPKTPPTVEEPTLPDLKFKKEILSRPSPPSLTRRHTTTAVGQASKPFAGESPGALGWEERAAAFMLKRQIQRSAMEQQDQQQLRDTAQRATGPIPSLTEGTHHRRHVPHASEVRPVHPPRPVSERSGGPSVAASNPNKHHQHPHQHQHHQGQRNQQGQNGAQGQDVLWELERRRQNPRRGALLAAAWATYQDSWEDLNRQIGKDDVQPYLTFATVPWPVLRVSSDPQFSDPTEISVEEMTEFVLSPFHSVEKSKESRIRDAYVRWHPDESARWLEFVVKSERGKVKEGVERVNWCLNNLK